MDHLLVWAFSIIIGCIIGASKDRVGSGFVWSALFGPLGVLVVLFLPNIRQQKEEAERKQQLALQVQFQHAQLQQTKLQNQSSAPPPPGYEPQMRIASNGQDLGEMSVATVKLMMKSGKLTLEDYYLDERINDWMQLDCSTDLV